MLSRYLRQGWLYDRWLNVRRGIEERSFRTGTVPLPHRRKVLVLQDYLRSCSLRVLVETGTYFGETVEALREDVDRLITIELDPWLCERARRRFRHDFRVQVECGDSAKALPDVVRQLDRAALFWLDGHYSGGITARGDVDTPVLRELETILQSPLKHVVLVDDARAFDGTDSYPTLEELARLVHKFQPGHSVTVKDDIVRIHGNLDAPRPSC